MYWAGPIAGMSYELTKLKDGRIYVRYLPDGVELGDPRRRAASEELGASEQPSVRRYEVAVFEKS